MTQIAVIQTFVEYNYALHEKMWESIEQLIDAQWLHEVNHSHRSVRNQMVHLTQVDRAWLRGLQGDPNARQFRLDPTDYPTAATLRPVWDEVARDMQAYVAGLDDAALNDTVPGMMGPTWQVLLHVMNHGTDHRAQTLRLLHDLGAPTFDQDMIIHLWFKDRQS